MDEAKIIYCESCGYANNADAKFCSGCGKPLYKAADPVDVEVVEAEVVDPPYETGQTTGTASGSYTPGSGNSNFESLGFEDNGFSMEKNMNALEKVKEICGSGSALLLTLLITAQIALTIYLSLATPIAAIVGMIPMAIIAIGCWITYISSKAGRPTTAGFTMMSGVMIFYIVLLIIAFVFVAIVFVFSFIKGTSEQLTSLIIAAVITFLVFFLIFLLYKKIRKTITSARDIVRGEEDTWFSSAYVRFLMWITLICDILGTAGLFLWKYYIPTDEIMNQLQIMSQYNIQMEIPGMGQFDQVIQPALDSLTSWPVIANSAVGILITLFSLILLKKIRKAGKELQ